MHSLDTYWWNYNFSCSFFRKLIWIKYSYPHCALMQWKVAVISPLPLLSRYTILEYTMKYFKDVKETNIWTQPFLLNIDMAQPQLSMGAHLWVHYLNHCINICLATRIWGYSNNFCFYLANIRYASYFACRIWIFLPKLWNIYILLM